MVSLAEINDTASSGVHTLLELWGGIKNDGRERKRRLDDVWRRERRMTFRRLLFVDDIIATTTTLLLLKASSKSVM